MAPTLIFGYGNPYRGDDALGPALIQLLERQQAGGGGGEQRGWPALDADPRGMPQVCATLPDPKIDGTTPWELLTDWQLQPEHVLELLGRRRVIWVDADASLMMPYRLESIRPERDASYSTHGMSPGALLWIHMQIGQGPPPPCFLLRIRGYHFALDTPLSDGALTNLSLAEDFVLEYLGHNGWRGTA